MYLLKTYASAQQNVIVRDVSAGDPGYHVAATVMMARAAATRTMKKSMKKTRRSVEHCTPHADGAWLNELGWSQ